MEGAAWAAAEAGGRQGQQRWGLWLSQVRLQHSSPLSPLAGDGGCQQPPPSCGPPPPTPRSSFSSLADLSLVTGQASSYQAQKPLVRQDQWRLYWHQRADISPQYNFVTRHICQVFPVGKQEVAQITAGRNTEPADGRRDRRQPKDRDRHPGEEGPAFSL